MMKRRICQVIDRLLPSRTNNNKQFSSSSSKTRHGADEDLDDIAVSFSGRDPAERITPNF